MGYFLKNRQLQSGSTGVVVPNGTTGQLPSNAVPGMLSFNTSSTALQVYNGTSWATLSTSTGVTYTVDNFTGDGTTTTFGMSVAPSSASQIQVFVGGLYQEPLVNYTVSGTSLIFGVGSAPPKNAQINVIHSA